MACIDVDLLKESVLGWNPPLDTEQLKHMIDTIPTAEVVDYEKVAEILRNMFDDDCACNYNGYDEWLPMKCKYAENDCPMPKERLGCWKEFVKHFLDQLNTRTPKERGGEK